MCQALEYIKKEGEEKRVKIVAHNLFARGFDTKEIAQIVGYAPETVQKWLDAEA